MGLIKKTFYFLFHVHLHCTCTSPFLHTCSYHATSLGTKRNNKVHCTKCHNTIKCGSHWQLQLDWFKMTPWMDILKHSLWTQLHLLWRMLGIRACKAIAVIDRDSGAWLQALPIMAVGFEDCCGPWLSHQAAILNLPHSDYEAWQSPSTYCTCTISITFQMYM